MNRIVLAVGPVALSVTFLIRSTRPVIDPALLGVFMLLIGATVGTILANRIAAGVLVLVAAATFQPVVARDLSFSLGGVDSELWRVWAIVSIVSVGWTLVSGLVVLLGRPVTPIVGIGTGAAGVALGVALLAVFPLIADQPAHGSDLSSEEIAELPGIVLANYAYGLPATEISSTDTYRAKLVNPTDLPHTFTIDATGTDVYVPARRWAIVEIDADRLEEQTLTIICTIGDHEELGMRASLDAVA